MSKITITFDTDNSKALKHSCNNPERCKVPYNFLTLAKILKGIIKDIAWGRYQASTNPIVYKGEEVGTITVTP